MEYVRLGDLYKITKGKKIDSLEELVDGAIRYIQIDDLRNDNNLKYCSNDKKYVIADKDDLIIAWDGANAGTLGYGLSGAIGSTLARLSTSDNSIYAPFVGRYMQSQSKTLRDKCTGATIPHIQKSVLEDVLIPKYDINTQKMLSSILDKAQELIDKRKEQIEACDELIKSQFIEMFGDPIINNKEHETQLGEDVFKLSNGKTVPQNKRLNEGIPAYGGNGISYYTEEALFEKDTIVVGRVGFQSGNVHMVQGPLWITDNAMYISEVFDSGYELEFLYALMEHIDFTRFQDPGDLKKITQKPFMQMEYIKPPLSLQKEYIAFVQHTDKLKFEMQQSLIELEDNFNSLMQRTFKGELF